MNVIRKDPRLPKSQGAHFAKGKKAVAIDQRSGFKELQAEMVFEPGTNIPVHRSESDKDKNLITDVLNFPFSKLRETERIGLRHPSPEYPMSVGTVVGATSLGQIDGIIQGSFYNYPGTQEVTSE